MQLTRGQISKFFTRALFFRFFNEMHRKRTKVFSGGSECHQGRGWMPVGTWVLGGGAQPEAGEISNSFK